MQVERRPIADPHNVEVSIFIRKPKKVNFKGKNSKDNPYIFINTPDTPSAVIIISIINIRVSAPLISTLGHKRAKSLANKPFLSLPNCDSNQIKDILNNATLITYNLLMAETSGYTFRALRYTYLRI